MPTKTRNQNRAHKVTPNECEVCIKPLGKGYYLLTMITRGGRLVEWKMDSVNCLMEFARKYSNLDDALGLVGEKSEEDG